MALSVGEILEGKVTGITNFGAFVSLPDNKSGMVHISEVAEAYVSDINEHLKVGQDVKVKVITIADNGKISLSIKKAVPPAPKAPVNKDEEYTKRPQQIKSRPPQPKQEPVVFTGNPDMDWAPQKSGNAAFEDMMAKFKKSSDERASDMKRNFSTKREGSRRR